MPVPVVRDGGPNRLIVTVGVATAAFVAVAVAAASDPVPLAEEGADDAWSMRLSRLDDGAPGAEASEAAPRREATDSMGDDIAQVLTQVAVVLVLAGLAVLLARAVSRAVRVTWSRPAPIRPPTPAAPTGEQALGDAVEEGLDMLVGGPVDDVVVACWVRLEEAAAAGGAGRLPSETPAELAVRVLAGFRVPEDAVQRLLDLYRTARYSAHPLGEDDRAAAIAALGEIRRALGLVPT